MPLNKEMPYFYLTEEGLEERNTIAQENEDEYNLNELHYIIDLIYSIGRKFNIEYEILVWYLERFIEKYERKVF